MAKRQALVIVGLIATSASSQPARTVETINAHSAGSIDSWMLKEAHWSPITSLARRKRDVIRVASVQYLAARAYVQITSSRNRVSIEVADSAGNEITRRFPRKQWQTLVADLKQLGLFTAARAGRLQAGNEPAVSCHDDTQIEAVINGERFYAHPRVCPRDEADRALQYVGEVNRAALRTFPECGSGSGATGFIDRLSYCPTRLRRRRS